MPDKYSAFGSHFENKLRVYHQGGLDTYCGFYSVLNLINFLYFKRSLGAANAGDFIGAKNFSNFKRLIVTGAFDGFFPERPFGDEGLDTQPLKDVLSRTLSHFKINAWLEIEEDESTYLGDQRQDKFWFRIGAEKPFVKPNSPNHVLGIAAVMEDKKDDLGHWVVLVGRDHLNGTNIGCENGWNGVVLDSDRGYKFWKIVNYGSPQLLIRIQRNRNVMDTLMHWVYSFISASEV